jgi:hypothetical protein
MYQVNILPLIKASNIVCFSWLSLVEDEIYSRRMIFNPKPIANIFTLPYTGIDLLFLILLMASGLTFRGIDKAHNYWNNWKQ